MNLKLDENMPTALVDSLSALGHDVHTVYSESLVGRDDTVILAVARAEGRFLITQDVRVADRRTWPSQRTVGLMLIRSGDDSRRAIMRLVLNAFTEHDPNPWLHKLVVVSELKVRVSDPTQ